MNQRADLVAPPSPTRRLLYLVSEDWYFLSHRLPMARAARAAGYEVHVATRVGNGGSLITAEGFQLYPLDWRRGSINPLYFLRAVLAVRRCYRHLKPDLVHQVALWPSIVGSLAGLELPPKHISALAGLGFSFTSASIKARVVRSILRPIIRVLFNRPGSQVLVQNPDDLDVLRRIGIDQSRVTLIPGSGVDTDVLKPLPEPDGDITAAYVGRLLEDKGLRALIKAHSILRIRGTKVNLLIAGDSDPANPASISRNEINAWREQPGVTLLGHVPDIRSVWARAHIAVLPSRREGLPKSLLEAAACGRPMVATDVPGCREIVRRDLTGFLVPLNDPAALADAIERLAHNPKLRVRLGTNARTLVEREFSSAIIGAKAVSLYRQIIA